MSYMYGWTCSIRKVLSVVFPLFFLGEYAVAVSWSRASASCGLSEVEISRRTNKDGKYIEGDTIKVDIASDIAIVFFEFSWINIKNYTEWIVFVFFEMK